MSEQQRDNVRNDFGVTRDMFIVVVSHDVKPGMAADAARRIDHNGGEMARFPGYLFRYRMSPPDNPQKLVTITGWQEQADFERWDKKKESLPNDPTLSGQRLYAKVVREVFQVSSANVK